MITYNIVPNDGAHSDKFVTVERVVGDELAERAVLTTCVAPDGEHHVMVRRQDRSWPIISRLRVADGEAWQDALLSKIRERVIQPDRHCWTYAPGRVPEAEAMRLVLEMVSRGHAQLGMSQLDGLRQPILFMLDVDGHRPEPYAVKGMAWADVVHAIGLARVQRAAKPWPILGMPVTTEGE